MAYTFTWIDIPEHIRAAEDGDYEAMLDANRLADERLAALGLHPPERLGAFEQIQDERVAAIQHQRRATIRRFMRCRGARFTLNNAGTDLVYRVMAGAGMTIPAPAPHLPHPPEYGASREEWSDHRDALDAGRPFAPTPQLRAFLDDYDSLRAGNPGVDGIPAYKLDSPADSWIVTSGELRRALPRAPEVARDDDGDLIAWWVEWLEFLRGARDHGGFEVT